MTLLAALPVLAETNNWGHPWWPIWPILWVALIGVIVWLVVGRRRRRYDPFDRAREVIAERYAQGELTREEYRARLDDLRGPAAR